MAIVCYGCLGMEGQPFWFSYLGRERLMHSVVAKQPFRSQFSERKGNGRGRIVWANGTEPFLPNRLLDYSLASAQGCELACNRGCSGATTLARVSYFKSLTLKA